jgi:hypothetical protein
LSSAQGMSCMLGCQRLRPGTKHLTALLVYPKFSMFSEYHTISQVSYINELPFLQHECLWYSYLCACIGLSSP